MAKKTTYKTVEGLNRALRSLPKEVSDRLRDEAQAIAAQWLESFKAFPPRQKPASFSLEDVMTKMETASTFFHKARLLFSL